MRLIRLYIKEHLLLRNLDLRFNRAGRLDEKESYQLDFLVGVNGSGKSTLLRTLVEIFTSLQTGEGAQFIYFLEYELNKDGHPVRVTVDKHRDPSHEFWHVVSTILSSDGTEIELINPVLEQQYLPEKIIVYTTGSEVEWANLLDKTYQPSFSPDAPDEILINPINRFVQELPGHIAQIDYGSIPPSEEPVFRLLSGSRINAITLCGLLRYLAEPDLPNKKPLAGVLDAIGIEKMTGFSLRFRIYDQLSPKATCEELLELEPNEIRQASDRLLVFDLVKDENYARSILEKTNGAFGLYQKLDQLQENDQTGASTLQQVNIFLQRKQTEQTEEIETKNDIPGIFLLDWLSDGEKAFLGRMALLAMLDTQDSLIILDEPEAHFNDFWKREVVKLLDGMMREHTNHILITTHSSILLSDVSEGQISVFVKNPSGFTEQRRPGIKTFGADPSEIMMVTFDTELSSGAKSEEELVAAIKHGDREKVTGLLEMIGPGMWRFRLRQRLEEIDAASAKSS